MRDRLIDTLAPTRYRRFLVYVMGPYKHRVKEDDAAFEFLERLRDDLRSEGFNAFLATDAGIPLGEMDAGTQTMAFARASNAIVFVVRRDGRNLGVGIEVGAVLENISDRAPDRTLVVHESEVRSAMLGAVADRWDATIRTFETGPELTDQVRLFVRNVMRAETTGQLPFPPGSDRPE